MCIRATSLATIAFVVLATAPALAQESSAENPEISKLRKQIEILERRLSALEARARDSQGALSRNRANRREFDMGNIRNNQAPNMDGKLLQERAETALKEAFGDKGDVSEFGIRFLFRDHGCFLTANSVGHFSEGRVILKNAAVALFKKVGEKTIVTVVEGDYALLTLGKQVNELSDISSQDPVVVRIIGNAEWREIPVKPAQANGNARR